MGATVDFESGWKPGVKDILSEMREHEDLLREVSEEVCKLGFVMGTQEELVASAFVLGWVVRRECENPKYDRTPWESHSFQRGYNACVLDVRTKLGQKGAAGL